MTAARPLTVGILALQGELAQAAIRESDLARARDLAQDQYKTLAGKIQEAKIAVQESSNTVQVASGAAVPTEKTGTRLLVSAVAAGAVGLLIAAATVLFVDYWRQGAPQPKPGLAGSVGAND